MELKALEILKRIVNHGSATIIEIKESIKELEAYIANNQGIKRRLNNALNSLNTLKNNSCDNCIHLEEKEENLKNHCLIDVCRSCKRNNIDRWECK